MKVLFDSQIFISQRFGGISRYFTSLARELSQLDSMIPRVAAPLYKSEYLRSLPPRLVLGRQIPASGMPLVLSYASNVALSWRAVRRFAPDILHNTYYYPFGLPKRSAAIVTTIHDLIHEKYPDGLAASKTFSTWKKRSVREADRVICVSESTKRDVLEAYSIDESKVSVVYHGCDPILVAPNESGKQLGQKPYILFVGVRVGYKNFVGLVGAYATSKLLSNNFDVRCFGGGRFTDAELSLIEREGLSGRIHQVDGSDDELALAYKNARLLAYPSKYEGFGFPLLEAMSLKCPIACGSTSALPEVAGTAAEYFDPEDQESMRHALETLALSDSRRKQLIEIGSDRISMFSWAACAQRTAQVYRSLK